MHPAQSWHILLAVAGAYLLGSIPNGLLIAKTKGVDLRRTGSTILNELGFNSDWIEKCLAHEDGRSSRGVYNKAEYGEQRRHMLQEWADMIDAWVAGKSHTPTLLPPTMKVVTTTAPI